VKKGPAVCTRVDAAELSQAAVGSSCVVAASALSNKTEAGTATGIAARGIFNHTKFAVLIESLTTELIRRSSIRKPENRLLAGDRIGLVLKPQPTAFFQYVSGGGDIVVFAHRSLQSVILDLGNVGCRVPGGE